MGHCGWLQGMVLFNICINNLTEMMECALLTAAGGAVSTLESRAPVQRARQAGGGGQQRPDEIQHR